MLHLLLLLSWHTVEAPAEGPSEAIGGYSAGCLIGGVAAPASGPGFEVIRRQRRRYFAHPTLLTWLEGFGARIVEAKQPPILVGDMAQARGGRMPRGHRSHQSGLDVDLWFTAPKARRGEDQSFASMVTARETISKAWGPLQAQRLAWAAASPEVARVFVNWVIKRHLCATQPDAPWLGKIRPWFGHDRHFHVRLRCPEGSPDCEDQPLVEGSGCGEEAWFSRAEVLKRKRNPPPPPPKPAQAKRGRPARCQAVLRAAPQAKKTKAQPAKRTPAKSKPAKRTPAKQEKR
ncbi:penicillin-insensitive murein endopeptidase [Myxococcota bacterium]|nr:penicillin-insensitive murein endopeptidase [Myxococcota bacterium]MBU1429784.1 penicillin-insensitive murein endopeptidase [Myxococcota bacterium]MBU1900097.1 penicillin-insensitive murein endopeptidase [Myxococcota bacterium]